MRRRPAYITSANTPVEASNTIVPSPDSSGNITLGIQGAQTTPVTIPVDAGDTVAYITAPVTGTLSVALFTGTDVLAASNTNYLTWAITNLGQNGSGTNAMLAASTANTTKTTGGTALAANTVRTLTLSATSSKLAVTQGDRIKVVYTVTGTLANSVTNSAILFSFIPT